MTSLTSARPDSETTAAAPGVALATYAALPSLSRDDALLASALAARGIRAHPVVWDDARAEWGGYAAVVVRSCWDYTTRLGEFLRWMGELEACGVALWNAPDVLRWNVDKRYLGELAARGVAVVPTRLVERGDRAMLASILGEMGWDRAVVKPAVSASARDTWRTTLADAHESEASFRELAAAGDVLVQPFVREVTSVGEWSLLFYGGVYSHAVRKRPRAGDFRVQTAHGGSAVAEEPDARVIAQAREALRAAPVPLGDLLYARVDGCVIGDRFVLMELELVEPELFLGMHPAAAERLAGAIARRLASYVSADARA